MDEDFNWTRKSYGLIMDLINATPRAEHPDEDREDSEKKKEKEEV